MIYITIFRVNYGWCIESDSSLTARGFNAYYVLRFSSSRSGNHVRIRYTNVILPIEEIIFGDKTVVSPQWDFIYW